MKKCLASNAAFKAASKHQACIGISAKDANFQQNGYLGSAIIHKRQLNKMLLYSDITVYKFEVPQNFNREFRQYQLFNFHGFHDQLYFMFLFGIQEAATVFLWTFIWEQTYIFTELAWGNPLRGVYRAHIKYITPTVWKMFLQMNTVWRFSFSYLHPNQPVILSSICWIALFYLLLLAPKIIWLFQGVFADVHFDHNSAWSYL